MVSFESRASHAENRVQRAGRDGRADVQSIPQIDETYRQGQVCHFVFREMFANARIDLVRYRRRSTSEKLAR
jgi:hypothetical protein